MTTRVRLLVIVLVCVSPVVQAQSTPMQQLSDVVARLGVVTEQVVTKIGDMRDRIALLETSNDVSPLTYGAKCDGTGDDTVGIQAAIFAALPGKTVVLPARGCRISDTLAVGNSTGTSSATFVSIKGSNPVSSALYWVGPNDRPAIKLVRNKYFRFSDFGLILQGQPRGTSTGISFYGYGGIGTEVNGGVLDHVNIDGFHVNISAGSDAVASSEILYQSVMLANADICWENNNLNTLNHVFTMLVLQGCGIGVYQHVGNISVRGGATSHNGIDFKLAGPDMADISGIRAELSSGATFIDAGLRVLRVAQCHVTGVSDETTAAIRFRVMRHALIEANFFLSRIVVETYVQPGGLHLMDNSVNGDVTRPVFYGAQSGDSYYAFTNNVNNGGTSWLNERYQDASGLFQR